jgi:predicted PurR-regulated permease PerM
MQTGRRHSPSNQDRPLKANPADWLFFRHLLIAAAVVAGLYLVWQLASVLLLLFASILIATLLAGATDVLTQHTFLSRRWALAVVTVGTVTLLGGFLVLFGTQLLTQLMNVFDRAPEAVNAAGAWFGIADAWGRLTDTLSVNGQQYFTKAALAGYSLANGLGQLLLVCVAAIYLAADPYLYRNGLVKLFPGRVQDLVVDAVTVVASALRLWFMGQLLSMLIVGSLSALAYSLIGLPIPLGLGAIAGITNFIPLVGPFIGAVPAVLFAFTIDIATVAWTVGAILLIQQIESYVATPLIQRQIVALPPALLLFALVACGLVFGWLGVVLAAPITVTAMVLVQRLWVREVIGEKVKIAGESRRP